MPGSPLHPSRCDEGVQDSGVRLTIDENLTLIEHLVVLHGLRTGNGEGLESLTALREQIAELQRIATLLPLIRAAIDGYYHVAHCVDCGEMSVDHCTEGRQAQEAIAVLEAAMQSRVLPVQSNQGPQAIQSSGGVCEP